MPSVSEFLPVESSLPAPSVRLPPASGAPPGLLAPAAHPFAVSPLSLFPCQTQPSPSSANHTVPRARRAAGPGAALRGHLLPSAAQRKCCLLPGEGGCAAGLSRAPSGCLHPMLQHALDPGLRYASWPCKSNLHVFYLRDVKLWPTDLFVQPVSQEWVSHF